MGLASLRPCLNLGGTFFIRDDHPMFMTIGEDVSDGLKIEQPYFQLDTPMTWDDDSSYVDTPGAPSHRPHHKSPVESFPGANHHGAD